MNKTATTDFSCTAALDAAPAARTPALAQPPSVYDLPPGEGRKSLRAVHEILYSRLCPTEPAIYEAGGGSMSFLPLDFLHRARVTVVDIDQDQLNNNDYAHEKILGDVQTYRFKPGRFDLVICYNVIEHLPDVESALTGFFQSLKQGGLILIGAPNPTSLTGIATKYTPHWFHIWFYRYVLGDTKAGLPGEAPFPTFFHRLVTLSNLESFATAHGLELVYRKEYESPRFPEMRARNPMLAGLLDAASAFINCLLLRKIDVRRGDYHVILRKR